MSILPLFFLAQLAATPAPSGDAGVSAAAPTTPADAGVATTPPARTDGGVAVAGPTPADVAPAVAPDGEDDDPDEPDTENPESAELEAIKALEETALNPGTKPAAKVHLTVSRLGVASPLRARMEDAFEDAILREDALYELGVVTDLGTLDVGKLRDEYDIPVEMQPLVAQYIEFFQGPGRKWFRKWMGRSRRYIPMLQPILEKTGVPKDTVYLAMIESGFSTQAYSRARAAGIWQFISSTGKLYGLHQDFWVDERRDFIKATKAAGSYLHNLYEQLGHWYLAWAGYNAGGGKLQRAIDRLGTRNFWELSTGRNLAKETQHYVPKLIAAALVAKHPQAFGFQESEFETLAPLEFEEVQLVDPTDLEIIARAAQVPLEEIRELNPELVRWCTPPATKAKPYTLRLPKGSSVAFAENYPKIAPKERLTFAVHRVKRGDTLSQIARAYHSAPEPILQLNHLRSVKRLRINSDIVIPVPRGHSEDSAASAALEHQVERARRHGFVALKPEDEIPAGTPKPSAANHPGELITEQVNGKTKVTYTIEEGDNLWALGQRFGVSVDELRDWNQLSKRARLQLGQKIVVWPRTEVKASAAPPPPIATTAPPTPSNPVASPGAVAAANPTPVPPGERPKSHQLEAGESLWSVSQKYGIPLESLKRWNHIKHANALKAGQTLSLVGP